MGLNQMLVVLGLIAIFSLAFINFGVNFAEEQNSSININEKDYINNAKSSIEDNSETFIINSNDTETVIQQTTIEDTSQSGSFSKISIFTDSLTKPFIILGSMFTMMGSAIFGGNSEFGVIFGIIITILGLIILFAGYKLLKGGNPD